MAKRRLARQILFALSFGTVAMLVGLTLHGTSAIEKVYYEDIERNLFSRANLVRVYIADAFEAGRIDDIRAITKRLGGDSDTRITIVDADGKVLGDSEREPREMENHRERPEIAGAFRGEATQSIRYSNSVNMNMMYTAVPLRRNGSIVAVVRTALPLTDIQSAVASMQLRVVFVGALIALLASALIYFFIRRLTHPIIELRKGAEAFARGDFAHRLPIGHSDEVGSLANAMTMMASELDARIRTILQQRNEQEAVLASMVEGVIAVDNEERVITINDAARRFFDVEVRDVKGRSIQETVRSLELQAFAEQALSGNEPIEGFITVQKAEECYLQAYGTSLKDASGAGIGAVIVVNDVTRLRKLESLRRDFVANVSHELKTPVTSIKGFVETLMDGAAEDAEARDRFLSIVAKEADRLHNIIEDLLSLSRIEQESERSGIVMEAGPVAHILESAAQSCRHTSEEKSIAIRIICDPALRAKRNAHLLEQAVANLVDNAVKYSDNGAEVTVSAESSGECVMIQVKDTGCGIPAEHLSRIFERFYRVDKSRSRKTGSSGLGLAIVKHIVQAHGGQVSVESFPGSGSIFTITLQGAPY